MNMIKVGFVEGMTSHTIKVTIEEKSWQTIKDATTPLLSLTSSNMIMTQFSSHIPCLIPTVT